MMLSLEKQKYYNNLFAEFIGVDVNYSPHVYKDSKSKLRDKINNRSKAVELEFCKSYDWIMVVVEELKGGVYITAPHSIWKKYDELFQTDLFHMADDLSWFISEFLGPVIEWKLTENKAFEDEH